MTHWQDSYISYRYQSYTYIHVLLGLLGESAGSIAVDHYSYAWAKKPIVKGLISESGSVYSVPDNSKDESSGNFTVIATAVGCNTTEPEAQLQCMKKQDAKDIIDAVIASKGLTFNIIIDERTVCQCS